MKGILEAPGCFFFGRLEIKVLLFWDWWDYIEIFMKCYISASKVEAVKPCSI